MSKEEILNKYIDLIDKGYCCACNELNCIDNFPHAKITHAIRELQQENQELKLELSGYRQAILEDKDMLGLKEENKKYKEVIDKATNELFILKDMIYKPETREENFEIQRKISSIIKRLNGKEVE